MSHVVGEGWGVVLGGGLLSVVVGGEELAGLLCVGGCGGLKSGLERVMNYGECLASMIDAC